VVECGNSIVLGASPPRPRPPSSLIGERNKTVDVVTAVTLLSTVVIVVDTIQVKQEEEWWRMQSHHHVISSHRSFFGASSSPIFGYDISRFNERGGVPVAVIVDRHRCVSK